MATNPMQRKARNSFLLGMLITLVVLGAIIALLFVQLKNYKDKEAIEKANLTTVYVLNADVKSGQIITTDMIKQITTNKNLVPANAMNDKVIQYYSLTDKEGNSVITEYKNNDPELKLYIVNDNKKYDLKEKNGFYYIEKENGDLKFIEFSETPLIAKINMNANNVLTPDAIVKSNERPTNDLRVQEYNMIEMPSQIETGDYVDVRMALPTGQDYIVVSKKQIDIPLINGVSSDDTFTIKLKEDEIVAVNNAIVDTYRMPGARIYINRYVEAGIQDPATTTYIPTGDTMNLILNNPNILDEAKTALRSRYDNYGGLIRNPINASISGNPQADENLTEKIEESQNNLRQERKEYLESLLGESY